MPPFVSRAGEKLDHAMNTFQLNVTDKTCADLGSNVGGFVDCLLQRGAAKVYAVETGYGVVDWKLRKDPRVVVMERTNAMHVTLPELVSFITIDVAWTKQKHILPAARRLVAQDGLVVTLIKPHYEADPRLLHKGILPAELVDDVVSRVKDDVQTACFEWIGFVMSPLKGAKGNTEVLALLKPGARV